MSAPVLNGAPFDFFFVRHGITEQNLHGVRCGGDLDVPLMDLGCDQAYLMAKQVRHMDLGLQVIVAAGLIRARQTALIMSGVLGGLQVVFEPEFNERRLGEWNNQSIEGTEKLLGQGQDPPGGETEAQFTARVRHGLDLSGFYLEQRALVVSSKGVARVLNTILGGTGRLAVANGEVVEFIGSPGDGGKVHLQLRRPHQV
jgi:2,3-bisphosphoglycerate-dependent phosphoglycerate mutase